MMILRACRACCRDEYGRRGKAQDVSARPAYGPGPRLAQAVLVGRKQLTHGGQLQAVAAVVERAQHATAGLHVVGILQLLEARKGLRLGFGMLASLSVDQRLELVDAAQAFQRERRSKCRSRGIGEALRGKAVAGDAKD